MFAVDVCRLPETGGSTFGLVAGLFLLVSGVVVTRWVRRSAGRLSVVVAPLVFLGGLALAPQITDPCSPTTTVAATTTVAPTTTVAATTTVAPTTTTTVTLPCAEGGACVVGDTGPGGGIVFYVADSTQPWGRYLEAACVGWSDGECGGDDTIDPTYEWGCPFFQVSGAEGTAIGAGEQNTADIVDLSTGCAGYNAAGRADAFEIGSQDDWFLPSRDELKEMHRQRTVIGGFTVGWYWSSSQDGSTVWFYDFEFGYQSETTKDVNLSVRPVRAF
jgi:hypothetical protein